MMVMTNHLGCMHRHHRRHRRRRRRLGCHSGTDTPYCVEAEVAVYHHFDDRHHNHPPEAKARVEDLEGPDQDCEL